MTERSYYGVTRSSDYLAYHGILGMKRSMVWSLETMFGDTGSFAFQFNIRKPIKGVADVKHLK